MEHDLLEVRKHLSLLSGESDPIETFQTFYDEKNILTDLHLEKVFNCKLDDGLEYINWSQNNGAGVYVTVNKTDGKGRKKSNIIGFRFLFADRDNQDKPNYLLEPTFSTGRDDLHGHDYWRIPSDTSENDWVRLQKTIALCHNTDQQVVDTSRVLRLAGFMHLKDQNDPKMYKVTNSCDKTYTLKEVEENFKLNEVQQEALEVFIENKDGITSGDGYTNQKMYIDEVTRLAEFKSLPAISGNGSNTLYRIACSCKDLGVDYDHSIKILWDKFNPRCEPPWTEDEYDNKNDVNCFTSIVKRAYSNGKSKAGCKTVVGKFSNRPLQPLRTDGFVSRKKLQEKLTVEDVLTKVDSEIGIRLNREQGSLLMSQSNSKMPDFEVARAFDGLYYDGCKLIRCEKTFYKFNGRIWKEIDPDLIKSQIQNAISLEAPPNKRTSGILSCLTDLVAIPEISNGVWLNGEDKIDPENLSVYKNGIVDLSCTPPKVYKHTPYFFTFNERDYNYDPNSLCPMTDAFLLSSLKEELAVKLAYQFLGYCLTNNVSFQKMLLLIGKSRSGKGIWTNLMTKVIGRSSTSAPQLNKLDSDPVLVDLSTKSVCFINDVRTPKNIESILSTMLQIVGNDSISANRKFKSVINFEIKSKIIMTANMMPDFIDASGALSNRLLVLYFPESFAGKEDLNLTDRLDSEIAGIAVKATLEYKLMCESTNKFSMSKNSLEQLQEIKDEMFKLSGFVGDMCEINPIHKTKSEDLYRYYKIHSNLEGVNFQMTNKKFNKDLSTSDLPLNLVKTREKGYRVNYFHGIRIRPQVISDFNNTIHGVFSDKTQSN